MTLAVDIATWPASVRAKLHPQRVFADATPAPAVAPEAAWARLAALAHEAQRGVTWKSPARTHLEGPMPEGPADAPMQCALGDLLLGTGDDVRASVVGAVHDALVDHWVAGGDLARALAIARDVAATRPPWLDAQRMWVRLARHVAHAPEAAYRAAFEAAPGLAPHVRAFVFPESGEGDRIVLATPFPGVRLETFAVAAITRLDALARLQSFRPRDLVLLVAGTSAPTALGWVARFGDEAVPLLAQLLAFTQLDDVQSGIGLALGALATPRAFAALLERIDRKLVRAALFEAALRSPARALGPVAEALAGDERAEATHLRTLLAQLARADGVAEIIAGLPAPQAKLVATARGRDVAEATRAELPTFLAQPRWLDKKKKAPRPELEVALACEPTMRWPAGLREDWADDDGADAAFRNIAADGLVWLDHVLDELGADAARGFELLVPFAAPEVAARAADALATKKRARAAARAWIMAQPEAAAVGLVPIALGRAGKARNQADAALRMLANAGHEALVVSVAARAGDAAAAAMREVLARDPLDVFPARMPKVPELAAPAGLPRPVLRDDVAAAGGGKALPAEALEVVMQMLIISRLDEAYPGVALLKDACTPASLGAFAWALFERWLATGDAAQAWAFTQLGLIGDDACARRLVELVKRWPGEGLSARATTGLDVLVAMGSDLALMHLHALAQKLKNKTLRDKAVARVDELAAARGLSADELADRLVPDLGLDERGTLALDFGPRRFTVGFDGTLAPFVRDEAGAPLKDLPRGARSDDEARVAEARAAWAALKKDGKLVLRHEVERLERAMVAERRWPDDVFRAVLLEHPLMRHVVTRLVWGAYEGEGDAAAVTWFRVAEDLTFADLDDAAFAPRAGASIGLAHPLTLPRDVAARFAQTFEDYGIMPPFEQLTRRTYTLTPEELARDVSTRWSGTTFPGAGLFALEARGWQRAPYTADGTTGHQRAASRVGVLIQTSYTPGLFAEGREPGPQTFGVVRVTVDPSVKKRLRPKVAPTFGALSAIDLSELVRDLEILTRRGG